MKKNKLQTRSYKALLEDFTNWLDILGFSATMQKNYPAQLCEFLYWLEQNGHTQITTISKEDVKSYYRYLQQRPNKTRGGGLSKAYLNAHQNSLKKFREYLKKHHHKPFEMHIKREKKTDQLINYCTPSEIKALFNATNYSHQLPRFRARNKALLVCLYSLGMRRNEVINLQLNDILWDKERVFVRKGKNYKERFVPINRYNLEILEDYVFDGRMDFNKASESEYVFVTQRSQKISSFALGNDLQRIVKATHNTTLQTKNITPHSLRHSIATHFLQAGMPIEDIRQFLGHSSLESTQIYTHLAKQDQ